GRRATAAQGVAHCRCQHGWIQGNGKHWMVGEQLLHKVSSL
ncbi:hypothetical protein V3C99_006608, partial [Haemonchus contortus]